MERRCVVFLTMLFSVILVVSASSQTVKAEPETGGWTETYGGTMNDWAHALVKTNDGGYAMAGYTNSFEDSNGDFWLVKTDASGTMQWNKTYGGTDFDGAWALVQTTDGGYAIAGETRSFGAGSSDFWLVKADASGNMLWNKTYGGTMMDQAFALVQASDGGYAIAGETESFGLHTTYFWLVKTDASGTMQWNKTYGGTQGNCAYGLVPTTDGGYALAGSTQSSGVDDALLVKTDASGNMQWNKTYGGTSYDYARDLVQTSDNGYALAGWTRSFGAGGWDFWLIETDAAGNALWNKTYGGTDSESAQFLMQTTDGGYTIAGYTYSFGAGNADFWLVKTDASGTMQWNQTYGGTEYDEAFALVQTTDGGYAIAGRTYSFGAGSDDFWLIKTDASGVIPEFPSYLVLGALLALTSSAVIVAKRRFRGSPRKPY